MKTPPSRPGPLLQLPVELLLEIFSHAGPEDQLCLALSCRWLLHISTARPLLISSAAGHRSLPFCPRGQSLLRRIKPLDARGRQKRTLALCCDCLRYRPRRLSYWKGTTMADESGPCWSWVLQSWKSTYSAQCPECWSYERRRPITTHP
jgi:hypothetical protein